MLRASREPAACRATGAGRRSSGSSHPDSGRGSRSSPLNDRFGPSISGDFDAIVVSEGTLQTALDINSMRKANGRPELKVVKVDYVLAKDHLPISTSRIAKGEIDGEGNLVKRRSF